MRRFSNHVAASCCWYVAGMAFGLHSGHLGRHSTMQKLSASVVLRDA